MRLQFTRTAMRQYLQALAYIKRDNPGAARALDRRAQSALQRILDYPSSGRPLPEFPDSRHREVIVAPCRFFYRVVDDAVVVVAVWHGAQLPQEPE